MKLAFSTIGCPNWSYDEVVSTASDLGYDGFEVRGIGGEIYAPDVKQFKPENIEKTKEKLKSLGLGITMLTSGASLAVYSEKEKAVAEAKAYIDLAESLGVPYIRVMCTNRPMPDGGDIQLCKRLYKEILSYASGKNVLPLIETNGIFCDTKLLRDFVEECDGGVLWDINHPYRFNGKVSTPRSKTLAAEFVTSISRTASSRTASRNIKCWVTAIFPSKTPCAD